MRWILPDGTHIAPDQFIPVAEEFGHIHALGDWALAEACAQSLRWAQIAGRPIPVAVNLSAVQFRRDGLIEHLAPSPTPASPPAALVLEITESVIMEDAASTQTALSALSSLGLKLAIDDFGTGYSSLAYLKRFPVSHLKIDRAFIKDLGVDPDDEIIVRTIIQLGHSLELEIVAGGRNRNPDRSAYAARLRVRARLPLQPPAAGRALCRTAGTPGFVATQHG